MSFLSCVPCGIACEQLIYLHDGAFGQLNPCGIEDASESIHLIFFHNSETNSNKQCVRWVS